MGCSSSRVSTPVLVPASPKAGISTQVVLLLTPKQKQLIRFSWTILEDDLENLGKQIFLKIFEDNPEVKDLFPFRCSWGDALIGHPDFKTHARRFMTVIQNGVHNLDRLDSDVTPVLLDLGAKHARYNGFKFSHFTSFRTAIMDVLQRALHSYYTPEMGTAWQAFLKYITDNLQDGYTRLETVIHVMDENGYLVNNELTSCE